jgi:chromosome segregation ATPase
MDRIANLTQGASPAGTTSKRASAESGRSKASGADAHTTGVDLKAALQAALERAERAEAELECVGLEREAYQQELFESERQSAWLAAERQGLIGQVAYLEAQPRQGEPMSAIQARLAELEQAAAVNASYVRSLESWISRAEERAAKAETELNRLRAAYGA